jgi:hypothetical protein
MFAAKNGEKTIPKTGTGWTALLGLMTGSMPGRIRKGSGR